MALSLPGDAGERRDRLAAAVGHLVARKTGAAEVDRYVRGELFAFADYVLFLNFDGNEDRVAGISAGIIFTRDTTEPLAKLDRFCNTLTHTLHSLRQPGSAAEEKATPDAGWQRRAPLPTAGYARFISRQDVDFLSAAPRRESLRERQHAAALLEDDHLRRFLRLMRGAAIEGSTSNLLHGETGETLALPLERLTEAGLLAHEILISCRKTGHALFQLPSPDALAVITLGNAKCSECGTPVADERVGEILTPTKLALSLLEDASWLINRVYSIVREFGVPPADLVLGPVNEYGEAHLIATVCGQLFALVLRDGDLTPAVARRAVDVEIETEATRLIVVITGRVLNEGRALLSDHGRRRSRGGADLEVLIIEGVQTAEAEIRRAFEEASQSALTENLCHLDDNLGLSVSRMVLSRFEVLGKDPGGGSYDPVSSDLQHLGPREEVPHGSPVFSLEPWKP
jgi:hypothetical protein